MFDKQDIKIKNIAYTFLQTNKPNFLVEGFFTKKWDEGRGSKVQSLTRQQFGLRQCSEGRDIVVALFYHYQSSGPVILVF